jgi:hypothetical protein
MKGTPRRHNNRALLSDYRPTVSLVKVGNTETTILGFGLVTIYLSKSLDRLSLPLINIAYILGFYINLISAKKVANAGIYLNSKECRLEGSDGTPIY